MSKLYGRLNEYVNLSVAVPIAVPGVLITEEQIREIDDPIRIALVLGLLFVTIAWLFMYYGAVRNELDLMDDAFQTEELSYTDISGYVLPTAICLAMLFGSLVAFAANILVYAAILPLLSVADFYGTVTVRRNLRSFIEQKRYRSQVGAEKTKVLSAYYVDRPLLIRIGIIFLAFVCALGFAIAATLTSVRGYEYVAYVLVLTSIIMGQIVINVWRLKRDRELERLTSLQRSPAC